MFFLAPNQHDILMGRGGRNNRHPGNLMLRRLSQQFANEYDECPRMEKPIIHNKVVHLIKQMRPPGHFLELDRTVKAWVEVNEDRAREKVSQHLRDAVKKMKSGHARPLLFRRR